MTQNLNNKIKQNASNKRLYPFITYLLLLVTNFFYNSNIELSLFGFFLVIFYLIEYKKLYLSKKIREYWQNNQSELRNKLDNQCFFGLSNTLILFTSGYLLSSNLIQEIFLSMIVIIIAIIIDRIIQAYICLNSKVENCHPSCELFSKIFCYYTKEESIENDRLESNNNGEKPLHALMISIRFMLISITVIILYLVVDDSSNVKQTLTSGGIVAIIIGVAFRAQINSMLIGAKLFFRKAFHINDWIEVPGLNIDGIIREINSFSVVVENWDKTKTNIPIEKFSEYSFKNWQNLNQQNMRRIKRSILIDINSIKELSKDEIEKLKEKKVLTKYLEEKEAEIKEFAQTSENLIERKITNIGTFRAFIEAHLNALQEKQEYKKIAPYKENDIRIMVRQLEPDKYGLPLEIYTFASTTDWKKFEDIQSDLFDYFLVTLKDFDLKVFQLENHS